MWISEYSKHESRAGGRATSGRPLSASRLPSRNSDWVTVCVRGSRKAVVGISRIALLGGSQSNADSSKIASSGATSTAASDSGQTVFSASSTRPIGGRSFGLLASIVKRVPIALRFLSINGA